MKKNILIPLALLAVIGIGVIIINACSKSDQENVTTQGKITHFSPSEDRVVSLITKFNQQYENFKTGYKSGGEDMKLGEAIWTLEAVVNYEFQSPKEDLGDFFSNDTTIIISVYVGEDNEYYIAEEDAMNLFTNMMALTGNIASPENVELYVADLELKSVENGQAEMQFEALAGGIDPFVDCNVNSTDYWKAANNAGKCSIYEYQYVGQDAASRINVLLNCVQLNVGYWTDIDNTGNILEYYDNSSDPCFWGMEDPGYYYVCLYPADISYWRGQAQFVIDDLKPTGKDYIDCRFIDNLWVGSGQVWFHMFENIRYGISHSGGGH
jgi:hypothetical protein